MVADFDGGEITSNAGGLLLGATDRAIGLVERFAACFTDGLAAERVVHEVATLVGQRVFGIALGYEDLIDHDRLRHDPVLGVVLGRLEARHRRCALLAGKSTLNRLEHGVAGVIATAGSPATARRSRRCSWSSSFAHTRPPQEIVLDLDATDDPLSRQEGRFFHGYYDCYCYLPLYVVCGGHLLAAKLRRADIEPRPVRSRRWRASSTCGSSCAAAAASRRGAAQQPCRTARRLPPRAPRPPRGSSSGPRVD